jgi:hypothetical protein
MITLTGTPAVVADSTVSPEEYSYLLASESPLIFNFQKVDGNVISVTEFTSPYAFQVQIEHDGGAIAESGTIIYVYDSLYGRMVEYTAYGGDPGYIYLDIPFEARFATDWLYVLSPQYTNNSYIEIRLKINGVYEENTIRYTYNTQGACACDISRFIQAKISMDKVGDYENTNDAETNQSGSFELEYRERYDGDSNAWVEEGNTWYYVYAVRTKEQGSNLYEYWECQFFNQFIKPVWWVGTPFDVQFWWNPKYTTIGLTQSNYDASGTLLSSYRTTALNDEGKGYLNSIRVDQDTIEATCDYIEFELDLT